MRTPTSDEVRSWPVTIDIQTAARAWGIGRDQAYRLFHEGRFPVPVLHLGRNLRVTRASVLEALGIHDASPERAPEEPDARGALAEDGEKTDRMSMQTLTEWRGRA